MWKTPDICCVGTVANHGYHKLKNKKPKIQIIIQRIFENLSIKRIAHFKRMGTTPDTYGVRTGRVGSMDKEPMPNDAKRT